jgi:hypothetical protein
MRTNVVRLLSFEQKEIFSSAISRYFPFAHTSYGLTPSTSDTLERTLPWAIPFSTKDL